MNWFDLLSVQRTLKSLLQHHSSKALILWSSALSMVQLSHPYMTSGKTIASTRWTFVGKVMPLLFNMLSRLVITFLPKSKNPLISWLKSLSTVILEPKEINLSLFPLFPRLFDMKWWDRMPWSSFFECWVLNRLFHSPLLSSSKGSLISLHFCHKGGVIYISEVIDISPGNLDSSLCIIQPSISHDVLCTKIK